MNLFTPPTDNLYKFLAIFGLFIMLFNAYLPVAAVNAWGDKALPYQRGMIDVAYDQTALNEDKQRVQLVPKAYLALANSFQQRQHQLDKRKAELASLGTPLIEYQMLFKAALRYSHIFVSCGAALMTFGFLMWFVKLQRYQDISVQINPATGKRWDEELREKPRRRKPQSGDRI